MRWITGANAGVVSIVKLDNAFEGKRDIEFWEELRAPIELGDTAELSAGCNKRSKTCKEKFCNISNFRGFPSIPGDDWVSDFPRADGDNNGGSRAHER